MLYIILFLLAAYVAHFYWKVSKYPKGPVPLPFFGNIFQLTPLKLQFDIERLRKIYGDVFTMWFFGKPTVIINREEGIKEAVITKSDVFLNRPNEFPFTVFQTTENGGITFASGENWRHQRREAIHILRDFGMGKNVMEQQVHEQIEFLLESIKSSAENKDSIELSWNIQVFVANVINNLLYGYSYPQNKSDRLMKYAAAINSIFTEMFGNIWVLMAQICPPSVHIPYIGYRAVGRHVEKYQYCLDFVKEDVKKALVNFSKEDEPNCLAQAYFKTIDSNEFQNMENLYNVCADFFMAGMETTATTIRWATVYLADHQDVQNKMRSEIARVVGFDRLPSLKDRPEMPYTSAVIVELQRITNVIGFSLMRQTSDDCEIKGIHIPAGTNCVPQIYSCHIDERFFPEPEKFKPERFMNTDASLNTDLIGHTMQFGTGKRQCAGEALAKTELFLGITALVQRYRLSPAEGVPIDYASIYGTFVTPAKTPLRLEEVNPADL